MSNTWDESAVGSLFELRCEKQKQVKTTEYLGSGELPVIDQSVLAIAGYVDGNSRAYCGKLPVIVFGDHTRNTKFINFPFAAGADGTQILAPRAGIDARFLYYVVSHAANLIGNYGYDRHLKHLRRFIARFPTNIAEQQRIAEILAMVDESIEQTEALVQKWQQVKAGVMYDLFTRGVTPDGKLRPTQQAAPQLYKQSLLGWIPREWEVKPCSELCEQITVGIVVRPTQYYVPEGVPAFRSANVREDGIDPSDLVYISPLSNALLFKSQLRAGDVISVRTGYPGTSAVVSEEFAGANCVDLLISRPLNSKRSNFLSTWINSPFGKNQVLQKQGGLAQQHFNVGEMRNLLVIQPKTAEQDAIVEYLESVSTRIKSEQLLVAKLRAQKQGLMLDLLTGRVPVKIAAN